MMFAFRFAQGGSGDGMVGATSFAFRFKAKAAKPNG
jgi:hypothetical protein